ncbi:MoxR family ATPase [Ectothiorhodospiraceae bacterium BW-2]|nr:MoxR family ATPase [Ectothiorhodospiraceae bacterium BW-2]
MKQKLQQVTAQLNRLILGKPAQIRLAITCLLARGHLLIEDLPGVGKTTLSHALAQVMGLEFNRIQFTADLLPTDILGASIYERQSERFSFHQGPIFTQVVLADEINRASPKCQSALLEAMEERQVSIEGQTYPLPEPFFVIATQNPTEQLGTYPLPESQLDRFLMVLSLGYPDREAELGLLLGEDRRQLMATLGEAMSHRDLLTLQQQVGEVKVSDALADYVLALVRFSREGQRYRMGLSPRAGLALLHAARAWALLDGRAFVRPDDVQAVLPAVVSHRLQLQQRQEGVGSVVEPLLQVPLP